MRLLIRARNREVAVEGRRIAPPDGGGFDLTLDFPEADVAPGLINAHDHLHRNHYGRLGRPPYPNAYAWAADIQARDADRIAEGRVRQRRQALLDGAWKNLSCGVTTVVHHDPWEPDFDDGFPLKVVRVASADSLGMAQDLDGLAEAGPFCLHLAEGADARAAGEVDQLAGLGLLGPDLIAVHGVGMDDRAVARFRASGAALVWCPTSNRFLFGRTAPPSLLAEGTDVLLGSDSRLTGDGDLLDEIRCARALGALDDTRLSGAVGAVAARRLRLPEPSLEPGSEADLIVVRRPVLEARAEDVLLVLVGGAPRLAHPELGPALSAFVPHAEQNTVGAVLRWTSCAAAKGNTLQ
jgi:cytosine/adenosine deaminase-related metal-dependent hydrolase